MVELQVTDYDITHCLGKVFGSLAWIGLGRGIGMKEAIHRLPPTGYRVYTCWTRWEVSWEEFLGRNFLGSSF